MTDLFAGLSFPAPGGPYATADDLLLVSDLTEVDLVVKRWARNGQSLRIRVRALDFDQQEAIDRGSLVKLSDGQIVKSEARFAALTLREAVLVPKLSDSQAQALRKHNPAIISQVVRFVWDVLSALDQELIDGLVDAAIPDPHGAADDAPPDADGAGEPPVYPDPVAPPGATRIPDPALVAT